MALAATEMASSSLLVQPAGVVLGNTASSMITRTMSVSSSSDNEIVYRPYVGEAELPSIMALVQSELSEPYVIYTYRYFLQQWSVPSHLVDCQKAFDRYAVLTYHVPCFHILHCRPHLSFLVCGLQFVVSSSTGR